MQNRGTITGRVARSSLSGDNSRVQMKKSDSYKVIEHVN